MKDYFIKNYRGHQFEFTRVLSAGYDPWYHITVNLNNVLIKYRMHTNKEGDWKITIERLPNILYSLEAEFNELILDNERPPNNNQVRRW